MTYHWSRAPMAACFCLVLLFMPLSGCGFNESARRVQTGLLGILDPGATYTVDFWEAFPSGADKDAVEQLAQQYMDQHPNVTINLQAFDSYDTLKTRLTAAIAAHKTPTMAQAYESWAAQYQQANALASLQPYISGKNGLSQADIADFYPTLWRDGQLVGTQYMLPFNKSVEVLYYNTDLLKAAGIKPPDTMSELEATIKKVSKGDGSRWGLSFTPQVDEWATFYKAFGGGDFISADKKMITFSEGANAKSALQAMDDLSPLVDSGAIHITREDAWQNDFTSGKAAFAIGSVSHYPYLLKSTHNKLHIGQVPLPSGPGGRYTSLYGTNLALFSNSDNAARNAAWDFMKFLVSPEANATFVQVTGYIPVRKSAYEGAPLKAFYTRYPERKAGPESIVYGFVPSILPAWDQCRSTITTSYTSALTGQLSSDTALQKMANTCNYALALDY
ncbi:ABC transporter substrate-binding protein [Ktedonobacter sp. SOSP1-85]|uniref:ABC transporter substrate-binding protein n=1 Tax=Ktedonobacter sp. SOSP1-85 TaxID=2778367 RepID=UPI0019154188|nr:ABC transporter substrate-binding protein [Ktedonobacter sp. SOSP1-85]GHO76053.1 ABC transporter substrate-binding protein [Ktedonobacter sp. SOSP1-85]